MSEFTVRFRIQFMDFCHTQCIQEPWYGNTACRIDTVNNNTIFFCFDGFYINQGQFQYFLDMNVNIFRFGTDLAQVFNLFVFEFFVLCYFNDFLSVFSGYKFTL